MIQFESVSKTFRDGTTAVDDLNLTVPSGQITVLVGPAGCGKSTTLLMVNRMLEPSKGRVTWDGKPIKSRRKTALRREIGYVIQNGGLFPHRTVLENIATVPELQGWDRQKTRKRAVELLGSVGLDRKLGDSYPAQLSGGQRQRVGVARALAADPMVLLMDEPFSAVDPVVRAELHEFLLNAQRDLGKTILLITDDIDEAIKLGDRVAILRSGGTLAQVGTPQQLLDQPADSFVEGFVGRDRGYRSLSFQPAAGLALGGVQVAREAGHAGGGELVLVVDGDARPVGWSDPSRPDSLLALGATFDPESDSLRTALDAALTSPVGLAVAVSGAARRYAGVVDADMILRQVTRTRGQIAESAPLQAHDEGRSDNDQGHVDPAAATGAGAVPSTGIDDPDATSVRGVPPVAAAGAAGVGAGAGAFAATAPDDEDPDATRISGPLPQQDPWTSADRDSPWSSAEHRDEEAQSHDTGESRTREEFHDNREPGTDPAEENVRDDEPYATQWPPAGDESFGTAYDHQLADDEAATPPESSDPDAADGPVPGDTPGHDITITGHDTAPTDAGSDGTAPDDRWADETRAPSQDPYDTPLAPEPDARGETVPDSDRWSAADHDQVDDPATGNAHPSESPTPAWGAPPEDSAPPEEPASQQESGPTEPAAPSEGVSSSDQPSSDQPSSDQPSSDQPSSDQPSSDRPWSGDHEHGWSR